MGKDEEIAAAREKLKNRFGNAKLGGKGTVRRKKKASAKSSNAADDKKLMTNLKRLNLQQIPDISEITMLMEDDTVLRFNTPKLQANIHANTFVVSGQSQKQSLDEAGQEVKDMMLGTSGMETTMSHLAAQIAQGGLSGEPAEGDGGDENDNDNANNDDDVPDLVDNFEEVSESA